ncbi:MAG: DNA primase [candidate division WOR-3 bacterium]
MDRDFVDKVREATDITQLMAERGIKLVRSGRRLKGLCPFHREKSPSFYVEPDLGLYHCFGCGASGDAIKFVMETEGMSFPEALDYLAERFGVPKPTATRPQEKPRSTSALEFAVKFYHERLLSEEGEQALAYLKSRGITGDSVNDFVIGYAPGNNALLRAAHEEGLGIDELAAGGLIHRSQEGTWFDFFRHRIVFPVYSPSGKNILGFSGRALGSEEPKYLNTPETSYFKKGELLYGLWRARQEIRKADRAVLVEGNLDVVLSHQAGIKNTVAPLGTAFTPSQARLLRKYTHRITIAFDGDAAGSTAARRAIPHLVQEGMLVMVARLPGGEDPASMVTAGKTDELASLLDSGEDWLAFLKGLYPDSLEGKKGFEMEMMGILKPLSPDEREAYLSRAKELLGYSQDWVIGVNRRLSEEKTSREPVRESKENQGTREVILISHAIAHQETEPFASGLSLIEPSDLSNPIARRLLELHRDGRSFTELLREEGLGERISAALTENNATEEDMRMSFVIMIMEARYNGLGRAITAAEAAGDRGTANAALAQKRFVLRIIDILRKIKERKALRYPERRNIILGKLWEIWEAITRGDDGRLAEVELDRLGRLLFRINEPVWDEEQTEKNKETETHGREKKR